MAFRPTRFPPTVGYMTQPENCQQCQDRAQPFWHMYNRHLFDLATVNLANVGAFALSLTEVEQWVRVTGCLLAAVFTALKIIETIRSLRK